MDEAFITSFIRYGDSDCIVRLFCKEHGRVSAFVKGGMKSSPRRGSAISAPAKARVELQARANSELMKLVNIDVAAQTYAWARSLRALGFVSYLLEITELFLPEHDAAPELFNVLDAALTRLSRESPSATVLRAYEIKLLAHCGYLPELEDGLAMALRDADIATVEEAPVGELRTVAQIFVQQLREHARGPLKSVEFLKNVCQANPNAISCPMQFHVRDSAT